ncbi:hypothetical protein [uncultured Kordia sp.]|uniref:hypothetical protein n=1 Tax=uncultured Kordia sp. TaxID=507699 RepID=UPI002607195E|nr:hypothetical protein [uncultured Kordia sp.]
MITLKDYIGKIYKEVTNAKVQSDIETLAIAQEYIQNPMLKHFAVPNIRIKDMELTIPVAVDTTQTVTREYTEREIQDVYEKAFYKVMDDIYPNQTEDQAAYLQSIKPQVISKAQAQSEEAVVDLRQATAADQAVATPQTDTAATTDSASRTVQTEDVRTTEQASAESSSNNYSVAVNKAAIKFAEVSFAFVGTAYMEEQAYRDALVPEIVANLQPKSPEIEELPVIIETQRLKEINDPASLISIKVNITDDAMEWTTDVDENGNAVQVLDYQ